MSREEEFAFLISEMNRAFEEGETLLFQLQTKLDRVRSLAADLRSWSGKPDFDYRTGQQIK